MSRRRLDKFLRLLKASPSGAVFNPWWQIDEENDIGPLFAFFHANRSSAPWRESI
jgi:hypothetical protein